MLKELYQQIAQDAVKAATPEFVHRDGDPANVQFMRADGALTKMEVDPPHRMIRLNRIADLVEMATRHFDARIANNKRMAVFYTERAVRLIFDTVNGYESAAVVLQSSEEHDFFGTRLRTPAIGVKELRGALRYNLTKCFKNEALVDQVSSLAIEANNAARATAGRGSESLGTSVLQMAKAEAGMPDEHQEFSILRWQNPDLDFRYPIQCILDPDAANVRWLLVPLSESWNVYRQHALDTLELMLRKGLDNTGIPIYQGLFRAGKDAE